MSRLDLLYRNEIRPALMNTGRYKSIMQVPQILKVSVNMGVSAAVNDKKVIQAASSDLEKITGQKPIETKAKKSIAGFKIREDMVIGCKVTLRRERMYEFLDRLINISMPRIRDFRGCNAKSFDGRGNYSLGIKEQIIFPEIDYDKIDTIRGLDITIVTTANSDIEALELLRMFNFPFKTN